MNLRLKMIEAMVKHTYVGDKYKALCEMIEEGELSLAFLQTQEAKDSMGSEVADKEKSRINQALTVRRAEKQFLENLK